MRATVALGRAWASGLLLLTLLYNVFEGAISVWAGVDAGSLTLVAFGADSYVEVLAAAAVLWRLSYRDEEEGEAAEAKALRFIGATFLLLAAGIVFEAFTSLANREAAETSTLGIAVIGASLALMPVLALGKLWFAARLQMPVLAAEAKETVACSYLSLTAFIGLIAIALLGWWWLDAVAALLLVPWLVKEGLEGIKGEACYDGVSPCFCRPCFFGLRDCSTSCVCQPSCCGTLAAT